MQLLEPLTIAGHTLKNRVVFGPIVTNLADGRAVSKRHVAFYEARAAGGCGLIVTEQASVHKSDHPYERCPTATEAGSGWADIADACHHHGSVVVAGLSHAGGQSTSAFSQRELWAPSDEPDVNTREVPKIMEQADIDAVVSGFRSAAGRAVAAGMDGVEINAGQYSLIRQFLSGLTNRREDEYGQDRALLANQVLSTARQAIGDDRILGLRLSCDELAPWAGITPESAMELAAAFAPVVDYLTVVRGGIFSTAETRPTAHHPPGFNLDLAAQIRGAVDGTVPIFAQGSIISASQAEAAIEAGQCDGVEMTRAQLADAGLVNAVASGAAPRPCVLCNQLCNVRDNRNPIISCIADPRCGHETTDPEEPQARSGVTSGSNAEVLVIGGGPAGLEAARVAARNGIAVELHDSGDQVGGMAKTAATAPAHQLLTDLVQWLEADAQNHGVVIKRNSTVSAEYATSFSGPVIIATGSAPGYRSYRTSGNPTILDGVDVLRSVAADDLADVVGSGKVLIWDPIGASAGVAVAELIAGTGRSVTLATPDAIAGNMLASTGDLAGANTRLQQAGVTILRRQRLTEIAEGEAIFDHAFTGERQQVKTDVVIDMSARLPNEDLWDETGQAMVRVGDAVAPRTVGEAIREGRAAAMALHSGNPSPEDPHPGTPNPAARDPEVRDPEVRDPAARDQEVGHNG